MKFNEIFRMDIGFKIRKDRLVFLWCECGPAICYHFL